MHEAGLVDHFLQRFFRRQLTFSSSNPKVQKLFEKSGQQGRPKKQPEKDLNCEKEAQDLKETWDRQKLITRLSLIDLQSVFVLALIGITLSAAVFTFEWLMHLCLKFKLVVILKKFKKIKT